MPQQPTSLLSLPDELLVQIFDNVAVRTSPGGNPILPCTLVCRRIGKVAQALVYRDVFVDAISSSGFKAAVEANPSLGQLVSSLEVQNGTPAITPGPESGNLICERMQATFRSLSQLKELSLVGMTPGEAAAILAALPSPSLQSLTMRLRRTVDERWAQELWTHLSGFSELRTLECVDWPGEAGLAHPTAPCPTPKISLPRLVKLDATDFVLVKMFGPAGPLRQTLPSLQELTTSWSPSGSDMIAILSDLPSSLTTLKLLYASMATGWSRYLQTLPPLRHLELGEGTFFETDLLAYLPTATLESIGFDDSAPATDRVLQALTGRGRPPQLRQIRLDHIVGATPDEIEDRFKHYGSANLHDYANAIRNAMRPQWSLGTSEEGLRLALDSARANGIEVTGRAVKFLHWESEFDSLLFHYMMDWAQEVDQYDVVIARYGEEPAFGWLEEHAPRKARLAQAGLLAGWGASGVVP